MPSKNVEIDVTHDGAQIHLGLGISTSEPWLEVSPATQGPSFTISAFFDAFAATPDEPEGVYKGFEDGPNEKGQFDKALAFRPEGMRIILSGQGPEPGAFYFAKNVSGMCFTPPSVLESGVLHALRIKTMTPQMETIMFAEAGSVSPWHMPRGDSFAWYRLLDGPAKIQYDTGTVEEHKAVYGASASQRRVPTTRMAEVEMKMDEC